MPLAFLLDEHFRGPLWQAIVAHNERASTPVDVLRIGGIPELPTGVKDQEILRWAERESRIVVSQDHRTLPRYLKLHLADGRHSPGVILVRRQATFREVVEWLDLLAIAGDPGEFSDSVNYIP